MCSRQDSHERSLFRLILLIKIMDLSPLYLWELIDICVLHQYVPEFDFLSLLMVACSGS